MVESPRKESVEGKRLTEYVKPPLPKIKPLSDEWAILQFLKKWTPDDITRAIDDDVDLANLLLSNWAATGLLRSIAKRNVEKLGAFLRPDNVILFLSCRRPDLHSRIVIHPRGEQWITKNFIKTRNILGI